MPYTVEVPGHGVVEVPDGVSLQQAQIEIEKAFPYTGEDIAGAMQDPSFTPTKSDYLKFEEYSKTKQVDWITTAAQAADAAIGMIGGAISEGAQGAAANPLNYIEGFAQGTRQLYGLAAQSQDPSSPLFKFKDLVAGTGTPESRYNQFLDARQFGITSARLERGEEGVWVPPEYTNPEYVQGVSMILDPTLFVPGVGEILGAGKLATRAVGKGAQLTGRAVTGLAKPLERFAGAAERIAAEAIGTTPEALRNVASTAGIAGALGIAPEAAVFAAIPAGIRTAREAGEALSRAGENLMTQPSRIGPLEAIGAAPGANLRQRMLGVIGQYGGDAAVDASLRGLAGGIEGAALGTLLGGLSGGEEGAAAGLGSGGVQGVAGAIGGRAYQKLTGEAAREARAGDLGRFIDGQQDPTTKALFERLRDTHGVDAASGLMDLQGLVRGKLGDVEVEYLSNEDFTKRYEISARGVQVDDKGGRPAVVINADIIGKGTGDGPLYTLGHELFHALEKSTQLQGGATEIKNALVGRWIQEGDTIRKLSEGAFSDADIEARFNQYRDKLGAGNASMADELAQYDTINKKADYVASELAAEHFAGLLAGQKPDALLKGFTGLTRQLVDLALTQNASRALAEAAATIERTFGVKPTDSVLFPDLKQASPQVNAMLRDLLRARRKLDEKINIQDDKTKAVLKPEDVANPLAAKQLIELGLAEQMPDGTVRAMSTDEIVARENKDRDSISAIIENTPGNSRMVDGVALGRLSPNQLSAIEQSQTVSSRMKDMIRGMNATMDAGRSLNITYSAALKKIVDRLTGKKVNRYSSGIRLSDRDMLPYSFYFSKAANPVVKAIDISKVRNAILKDTASNGSVGKGLWDNVDGFMGDLAKYFTNLDQKEGARRSSEIFGLEKAKYLGDFVGAAEKGESKFIRDFRLDRIGSMAPSGFRARFSEEAYQLSKQRWMPAEKLGDKSITNSEEGYRIISGAKHKLYGTDGKLIGIYDTQTQAERKADATQTRLQPEVRQQQRPAGDEGRQATEAGGRNRAVGGQEGQVEGGAVRQAGDVVIAPDAESFTIPKADMGRFMPASDKVRLEDYADRKIIALAADRMGIGQMTVGPKGAKRDLSVLGQGGRGFMNIFNGGGWAFSDQSTADRFISRLKKDADPNGNVIVGITVQSPINHLKNQTGQLAYIEAMQAAIDSKTITKRAADSQIAAMSSAIVNSTAKSIKQSARDKFSKINSLADLNNAVQNKQLNFADMEPLLTQMQRKALPITAKELAAAGISPADIARDIADPELADVPFGSVVALLGVNVKQAPEKTGFHYSYPWTIHGETIGYLDKFYNISDLTTEQRIRNKAGTVTAQPLQTVMPVMDNIINTVKTKQGIPSDPSMRFMPNQQGFYSKLEEVVNAKIPKVASPQQVLASVDPGKGSGVKPEELKWTGFAQAVERIAKENGGKVPKDKLIEHLNNEGSVNFEEVTLGTVWNVGDSNHTERYTTLKDALSAKEDVIDFLQGELERGWSVEEQDNRFVIVDEYGDQIRAQRSESGRVLWEPSVYRSEAEAESAIKEGAKDVAESSVVFYENRDEGNAIHSNYQLPGGENYREVVLTSDTSKPYTSSHYTDIENYVAHMRLNDRTANDGRNGLFIEEIQSDRHQQSREKGYIEDQGVDWSNVPVYQYRDLVAKGEFPSVMHIEVKDGLYRLVAPDGGVNHVEGSLEKLKKNYDARIAKGIADAPFRKDWSLQMFKRALRDAVSLDKKWIGWTTGDTQAARYDLSKQVDYIDYRMAGPDKYDVSVVGKNGTDLFSESGINQSRVSDVVGKEIADKMSKGEGQSGGGRMTLRGVDLQVGGEGMKGFYDKILPSEVQKYVKQWKGEVTKSNVPESEIWRVDITPQMRESINKIGQARFMPSDTDYLSAVKQGDTKAAQQMVDEAAKAAGYTIGPVYHGTPTGGFNVFDKRMRGETSGVARQAFSFTTDKKAAEGYSKRLGNEAVRLDAGLRVANDAMRMFDEDIAAQEYFSSKGYTSVDDGMLPEFDWGSIDNVPEFIKELRGYAKDLKPINKKLSDNFVEAAKVMTTTKAVPEVKRVFLRIPENAPVFQATPATLGQVMSGFSAENQPTKAGIVELPGGDRIYYVADSSQVKLADPVTKDLDGNVIPLSQRFKASDDIRYMPAGDMATGRSVKDHREAMDLFEKGYRLYGALYDGMEDPIRLKKASEIERFDPENLWAVPSKKIAAAIGIRNMPADIKRDIGRNLDFANPPTDSEAVDALSSEKKAKFGAARSIKPGTQVAARIDIPAFLRTGKYVVAVHEPDGEAGGPGKVIGYDTVTRLQNPKFVVKPGVQRIYEGKSAKFPVATVDGKIMADRSIPSDLENYVPVGMDPKEHAYFYDKRTDQPVISGSEAVSVGNTVFVKNPVYGKPEDFRFMPSPDSAMPGAYSFPGGYRALPGKAKGSLRIYSPAGSLIGIASSLDEAQRILRRKNK